MVQATYFAWRLSNGDLTGLDDDAGNRKGLDDARRGPAELGVDTAGSPVTGS